MGFLGFAVEVNGFSIEPTLLFGAVVVAAVLQVMKNEADKHKIKDESKEK